MGGPKVNPEHATRQSTRLEPETAWTVLTEAPLKGLSLAREAGTIFAWDENDQLYLLNLDGEHRSVSQAPGKVVAGAVSDDGSRIALLGEKSALWLLDADLGVVADRPAPPEPLAVAIDPHGRYLLVSSRVCVNQFYTRHGRPAGRFETLQPLAHLAFVPARPFLLAAASYGMILGIELSPESGGKLDGEIVWQERGVANVGRLTTTGDGSLVLASCFTHGIQRYDFHGANEGAYHLGGTAAHAVPDFAGRMIGVATFEGELSVINSAGNVRWKSGLARPAIALETDPLGRYLIRGNAAGEIIRLDLYGADRSQPSPRGAAPVAAKPGGGVVRRPDWTVPVASSEEQAESAVLAVLDEPPRIGLYLSRQRLQLFKSDGRSLGHAPEVLGGGRILRTNAGWIAGATDRQIVLLNAAKNAAQRVDLSLVEITHLAIQPDEFGIAVVQERDRVGRATIAGRWIWKKELATPIEDVAIGPDGYCALTTDAGRLDVFDPAGNLAGGFQTEPSEPLSLIEAVTGAPVAIAWITLARRAQILRGHDLRGQVLWKTPVPWEGWQLLRLDSIALITAPDGRALAYDGAGHLRAQGRASSGSKDTFGVNARGEPRRISRQGSNLICADIEGRVKWRSVCDEPLGPVAVSPRGVAALIGRSLVWFANLD